MAKLRKLARAAGRKRKLAERGTTGRIRQAGRRERADEVMAVARRARERVFGLAAGDAGKSEAGTVIGRLLISREITRQQYEAALKYEDITRSADRAFLARPLASAGDLDGGRGFVGGEGTEPDYVAACRAARAQAERCRLALAGCGEAEARVVVDRVVIENASLPGRVGELRIGLNALARVFRIPVG